MQRDLVRCGACQDVERRDLWIYNLITGSSFSARFRRSGWGVELEAPFQP
jgi:hypothetical protein